VVLISKISRIICLLLMITILMSCNFNFKSFFSLKQSVDSVSFEKSIPQSPSISEEEAFAKYLTKIGAVMYGAYWCPYCDQQKKLFGENFIHVKYVECDPRGDNSNPMLCKYKEIKKYPTWEIGGEMFEGVYTLKELEKMSGFEGFRRSY